MPKTARNAFFATTVPAKKEIFMVEKNKHYNIEITDVSSDGNGVGNIDGFAVFVPMTVTIYINSSI